MSLNFVAGKSVVFKWRMVKADPLSTEFQSSTSWRLSRKKEREICENAWHMLYTWIFLMGSFWWPRTRGPATHNVKLNGWWARPSTTLLHFGFGLWQCLNRWHASNPHIMSSTFTTRPKSLGFYCCSLWCAYLHLPDACHFHIQYYIVLICNYVILSPIVVRICHM